MTASDTVACDLPPKQRHIGGLREHAEACPRERYAAAILGLIDGWFEDYNFASLRPSFYVVEGNRFC